MNGPEIRAKIDHNNEEISRILTPNQFVLNNFVANLLEDNKKLQEQCPHCYEDGYCIYCDKEKEEEND